MFYFVIHIFYIKTKKIHFIFLLFYVVCAKAYESDIYYPKKKKIMQNVGRNDMFTTFLQQILSVGLLLIVIVGLKK